MFSSTFLLALLLSVTSLVRAAPIPAPISIFGIDIGDDPTTSSTTIPMSGEDVASELLRPALHSRAAYCSAGSVLAMDCGGPCDSFGGDVQVIQAAGDDGEIPGYYVAIDKSINSVVVAHQGTEKKNILSLINDAKFFLTPLNPDRFPNQPTADIQVHDGFQDTFERTADSVLDGVKKAVAQSNFTNVLVTGHSLGAAIGVMDSLMLKAAMPDLTITSTFFGLPRAGNAEFADMVDSILGDSLIHVSNQNDPVSTVPPQLIGYLHPGGEVHITKDESTLDGSDGGFVRCEGRENDSCSEGNSVLDVDLDNHNGPYFMGIGFGGKNCPA